MKKLWALRYTLLLAAILAGYLVVGKTTALGVSPVIMAALAALTMAHGGWGIVARCRFLAPASRETDGRGGISWDRRLELVMLLGLTIALGLGMANYLLGFQGVLEIIPGGEKMRLGPNLQVIEQGALSRPRDYQLTVGNSGFEGGGRALRLEVGAGEASAALLLEQVRPQTWGGLKLVYQGDGYLVALMVQRGNHDYLAAPVVLRPQAGSRIYRAALDLTEPGASGEVTLDPATGAFVAKVTRNGVTEFTGQLRQGEVATQGEMRLQITAGSHFGRILVQHRNYRTETLLALAVFAAAGLGRLLLGTCRRQSG